jgi:hypothetical protein
MDKPIAKMTEQELRNFTFERICRTDGCYNQPTSGIVLCEHCAFGTAVKAAPHFIQAKKRLEKEFD